MGNQIFCASETPLTTAATFEDVGKHRETIEKLTEIKIADIAVDPTKMEGMVDRIAEFIITNVNVQQLVKGAFSKGWNNFVISPDETTFKADVRENVSEMLKFTEKDTTLIDYIRRFINNVSMDQCGGFIVNDTRESKDIGSMKYLATNKHANMWKFVSAQLNVDQYTGFILGIEHDQESCIPEGEETNIKFHRFDETIHIANSAKALYYTNNLDANEFTLDQVCLKMEATGNTKFIGLLEKFKDKFVVFTLGLSDPAVKSNSLFDEGEVTVVALHNKSCGSKKDIKKNYEEYCLIASIVKSFSDKRLLVMGDFNVPKFCEGKDHFKLTDEDVATYPIHVAIKDGAPIPDCAITSGLNCYSEYSTDDVMSKCRDKSASVNSQALKFKFGPRRYNTDHIFGNLKTIKKRDSCLYPVIPKPSPQVCPYITGNPDFDWLSDHQAPILVLNDTTKIVAYNTLSNKASESQTYKDTMTGEEIDAARHKLMEYVSELCNMMAP